MYPSITKPTRITNTSATSIDNIFTNNYAKQVSGIILNDLSDHLPIFWSTNQSVHRNSDNIDEFETRVMSEHTIAELRQNLCEIDWEQVCSNGDANASYNYVHWQI